MAIEQGKSSVDGSLASESLIVLKRQGHSAIGFSHLHLHLLIPHQKGAYQGCRGFEKGCQGCCCAEGWHDPRRSFAGRDREGVEAAEGEGEGEGGILVSLHESSPQTLPHATVGIALTRMTVCIVRRSLGESPTNPPVYSFV